MQIAVPGLWLAFIGAAMFLSGAIAGDWQEIVIGGVPSGWTTALTNKSPTCLVLYCESPTLPPSLVLYCASCSHSSFSHSHDSKRQRGTEDEMYEEDEW